MLSQHINIVAGVRGLGLLRQGGPEIAQSLLVNLQPKPSKGVAVSLAVVPFQRLQRLLGG
jgi:hypothetical protein